MAARLAGPRARLAALSSSRVAPLRAPPPPCHPGADDPLRVVPEARQQAERTPSFIGLLGTISRERPQRSDGLFVVKRGSVGDADDQAILGEKPGHRLPPRLGAGRVQQLEARALKLAARGRDGFRVLHLELD
jgi:hypothetical protein